MAKSLEFITLGFTVAAAVAFRWAAQHQASLGLEAAIKHRYCQSLGENVTVRTKDGKEFKLQRPDYERIWRIRREEKGDLKVDGQPFLYTMPKLLDWLVVRSVITKWDLKICGYHLELRNILSHPTVASIHLPAHAFAALQDIAFLVNKMFHNAKIAETRTTRPLQAIWRG